MNTQLTSLYCTYARSLSVYRFHKISKPNLHLNSKQLPQQSCFKFHGPLTATVCKSLEKYMNEMSEPIQMEGAGICKGKQQASSNIEMQKTKEHVYK